MDIVIQFMILMVAAFTAGVMVMSRKGVPDRIGGGILFAIAVFLATNGILKEVKLKADQYEAQMKSLDGLYSNVAALEAANSDIKSELEKLRTQIATSLPAQDISRLRPTGLASNTPAKAGRQALPVRGR